MPSPKAFKVFSEGDLHHQAIGTTHITAGPPDALTLSPPLPTTGGGNKATTPGLSSSPDMKAAILFLSFLALVQCDYLMGQTYLDNACTQPVPNTLNSAGVASTSTSITFPNLCNLVTGGTSSRSVTCTGSSTYTMYTYQGASCSGAPTFTTPSSSSCTSGFMVTCVSSASSYTVPFGSGYVVARYYVGGSGSTCPSYVPSDSLA